MIEPGFQDFFLAVAGASATLIGLLFVAVSVAPEQVVGPKALALHQIRASMALTSFSSTLVLSLIAVMPDAHVGWPSVVIGVAGSLLSVNALRHRQATADDAAQRRALMLIVIFLIITVFLTAAGFWSVCSSRDRDPVSAIGIAAIALIVLGIDRSWELVGGRTTGLTGLLTDRVVGAGARPDGGQG